MLPGVYYGGWEIRNNVTLELAPGVYIIAGGGIGLRAGGSITSVQGGARRPAPVLFFNTDNPATGTGQGDMRLHGLVDVWLCGPSTPGHTAGSSYGTMASAAIRHRK